MNFKPGINKKMIVTRIVSNKAKMETRSFSTSQFLCEDKMCMHEDDFFNN